MERVALSLGANLGDRLENLREAVRRIEPVAIPGTLHRSSVYETEPVGCPPGSPSFLNAVIVFETELLPEALLDHTQKIEGALGRPEVRAMNSPRPVDIDILLFGDREVSTTRLTIPHPRLFERAFVLCPLAELLPEFAKDASSSDQNGIERTTLSL